MVLGWELDVLLGFAVWWFGWLLLFACGFGCLAGVILRGCYGFCGGWDWWFVCFFGVFWA